MQAQGKGTAAQQADFFFHRESLSFYNKEGAPVKGKYTWEKYKIWVRGIL